jgi:uncharacterized protein YdaT
MARSAATILSPMTETQRAIFGAWVRTAYQGTSLLLELQKARLEVSLRFLEAAGEANRRVFDAWLGTTQQIQRGVFEVAEQATERVAAQADVVARQHERELQYEQGRLQREHERTDHERERQERKAERDEPERPAINVVKREDDWAVIRENASRATGVFDTKREAVERARELAKRDHAEVHIGTAAEAEHTPEQNDKGSKR